VPREQTARDQDQLPGRTGNSKWTCLDISISTVSSPGYYFRTRSLRLSSGHYFATCSRNDFGRSEQRPYEKIYGAGFKVWKVALNTLADSKSEARCRAEDPGATFKPAAEADSLVSADSGHLRLCSVRASEMTDQRREQGVDIRRKLWVSCDSRTKKFRQRKNYDEKEKDDEQ
jgi:hypothetical protein